MKRLRMNARAWLVMLLGCGLVGSLAPVETRGDGPGAPVYHSPFDVAYSPDGALMAVTDATRATVQVREVATGRLLHAVALAGSPRGLAWHDARTVYVAEYSAGSVAEIDATQGTVQRRFHGGPRPMDIAVAGDGLLVTEFGLGRLTVIDRASGETVGHVALPDYPYAIDATPDGALAVVGHKVPTGDAMAAGYAATVSIVDLGSRTLRASIRLPHGASNVRGVRAAPCGRWAYVAHTLGKTNLPTTHLHKGWVNTNAVSVIDLQADELYATFLLDRLNHGAADPWGLAVSADGHTLWVSVAGTHQVMRIDLGRLHVLLAGGGPSFRDELARSMRYRSKEGFDRPYSDVWFWINEDPAQHRHRLAYDLGALWGAGVMEVIRIPGQGLRNMAVSPDGRTLAVAAYFTGAVFLVDTQTVTGKGHISLGPQPVEHAARRGERLFHDGTLSQQGWLSCATCHPGGRADGLNWDLPNDGIGNPKNTKSMLLSIETPPAMAHGVRADAPTAIAAGFRFIHFTQPSAQTLADVEAYVAAMKPEPSPYRTSAGPLTPEALQGRVIFHSDAVGCAVCHHGPYYTDLKTYDVGTRSALDQSGAFVTPHLIEMWRSAPYLHDGSAATMRDVLTTRNRGDQHGNTSHLTEQQLDQLSAYILQLGLDTAPSAAP